MQLSIQKDRLEAEYTRMPLNAGRTAAERRNKLQMEQKLAELQRQMGAIRASLRGLRVARR